jgi:phosphoglycolate phosphatase
MEKTLSSLKDRGKTLCRDVEAHILREKIIEHFGLGKYISFVAGSNMDYTAPTKGSHRIRIRRKLDRVQVDCYNDRRQKQCHNRRERGRGQLDGVLYGYGQWKSS